MLGTELQLQQNYNQQAKKLSLKTKNPDETNESSGFFYVL